MLLLRIERFNFQGEQVPEMHGVTLNSEDKMLRIGAAETITSAMSGIEANVNLSPTTFQQALDHWEYVANHVSVLIVCYYTASCRHVGKNALTFLIFPSTERTPPRNYRWKSRNCGSAHWLCFWYPDCSPRNECISRNCRWDNQTRPPLPVLSTKDKRTTSRHWFWRPQMWKVGRRALFRFQSSSRAWMHQLSSSIAMWSSQSCSRWQTKTPYFIPTRYPCLLSPLSLF